MSSFFQINQSNFTRQVSASKRPVLLEFGAPWCKPCKNLEPILLSLSEQWGGKINFAQVDVDECPDIAAGFGVMSVPTLILFVGGEARERLTGSSSADKIKATITPYLS